MQQLNQLHRSEHPMLAWQGTQNARWTSGADPPTSESLH